MLISLWRPFVYNLGCLGPDVDRVVLAQCTELIGTESQGPDTKRKPNDWRTSVREHSWPVRRRRAINTEREDWKNRGNCTGQ